MSLFKRILGKRQKGALVVKEPLLYPYGSGDWLAGLSPVVVFAPHPDDETFGCGGTLLLMAERGIKLTLVAVTDGSKGCKDQGVDPNHYVETRMGEFQGIAKRLGAECLWWGFKDRETSGCADQVGERAGELVDTLKPKAVFLPSPWEIHPDHRVVTQSILGILQGVETMVVFYEGVVTLRPNLLVDISSVAHEKMELMLSYSSQVETLPYHLAIEGLNRHRTLTLPSSVAAEAFVVLPPEQARELLLLVRESERLLLPATLDKGR